MAERLLLTERLGIPNPYFVAHEGPLGATTRVDGTVLLRRPGRRRAAAGSVPRTCRVMR